MAPDPTLYDRLGGRDGLTRLLRPFYADVRQHRVLGPIFNERIRDWPAHIAKITEFWARLTGGPSEYAGRMPERHRGLGLAPSHFAAWLELWDFNLRRHLAPAEAEEMSRLAHGIGARLSAMASGGGSPRPGADGVPGIQIIPSAKASVAGADLSFSEDMGNPIDRPESSRYDARA